MPEFFIPYVFCAIALFTYGMKMWLYYKGYGNLGNQAVEVEFVRSSGHYE